MFELAKTVLTKAGGNSSTAVLFTQPSASQNHRGPHRALHMCAFQIGLYALGLHNAVSPNWLSRTYSSHVSWITGLFNLLICIILMFFFLICYRYRLVNMYFFLCTFFLVTDLHIKYAKPLELWMKYYVLLMDFLQN